MNFFSIPFVATAVAIVISWALFAIFCSLVNEAICQFLAERGKFMRKYLLQQLQDPANGINWGGLVYQHGAVQLLSRSPDKPTNDIEPNLFATTLVDVVSQAHLANIAQDPKQPPAIAGEDPLSNLLKNPTLRQFQAATQTFRQSDPVRLFTQALQDAAAEVATADPAFEAKVYQGLVENIQRWYVEFTERLSLWYKKKTRARIFALALILSVIINVDSVQLFSFYNQHPDSAKAVVTYYEKEGARWDSLARQDSTSRMRVDSARNKLDSIISANNLPIGVQYSVFATYRHQPLFWFWVLKVLGLLISGFAASAGAPFWFDVLKKAIAIKV
jgi:hypothetical protein